MRLTASNDLNKEGQAMPHRGVSPIPIFLFFCVSFFAIFLEILLFHSLLFITAYLDAIMVISIALLGISLGATAAATIKNPSMEKSNILGLLMFFSIPIIYWALVAFSTKIYSAAVLLMFPFALPSLVLSLAFRIYSADRVYYADLLGAGCGAATIAICIEYAGEENSFFILCIFVCLVFMAVNKCRKGEPIPRNRYFYTFTALLLLALGVFLYHKKTDMWNFARVAAVHQNDYSIGKIYGQLKKPLKNLTRELIYSRSSVAGRVDVFVTKDKNGDVKHAHVCTNGNSDDSFKFKSAEQFWFDPRVPRGLLKDPDSLIVGTSAEGGVNPVSILGNGRIDGVEINPAKVAVMRTPWAKEYSYDAYQHLTDLKIIDARTFLRIWNRSYDHIVMFNTHLGRREKRSCSPEYIHTVEAFSTYLNRLKPGGLLNIEETDSYGMANHQINVKTTATLIEALRRLGVTDFRRHFYVFKWDHYMQFFVKREPFSENEILWLDRWINSLIENQEPLPFKVIPIIIAHPSRPIRSPIADMISGDIAQSTKFYYSPATDDMPYPLDILKGKPEIMSIFRPISIAILLVVLAPIFFLFFHRPNAPSIKEHRRLLTLSFIFYSLTGAAYIFVEVMLIQKLQIYIGSPAASLIIILGGMLVFSGLGSFFSQRWHKNGYEIFIYIAIFTCIPAFIFDNPPPFICHQSLIARSLICLGAIFPLAFFMGMPFPNMMKISKERIGDFSAGPFFAINCAFSAFGTPLAVLASMCLGFRMTCLIGVVFYMISMIAWCSVTKERT